MKSNIWGILAIAPIISFLIFAVLMIFGPTSFYGNQVPDDYMSEVWAGIVGVIFVVIWLAFADHARSNERLPAEKRNLWFVVILLGNAYVLPFYWWWYIREST